MKVKLKTLAYLLLAVTFCAAPSILFTIAYVNHAPLIPGTQTLVTPEDVAIILCFSLLPLALGFLGGEMYMCDIDEADLLTVPAPKIRKR